MPHCLESCLRIGSDWNTQTAVGLRSPLDTDRLGARFLCLRLTNVLLTKLNAGKSAIYL